MANQSHWFYTYLMMQILTSASISRIAVATEPARTWWERSCAAAIEDSSKQSMGTVKVKIIVTDLYVEISGCTIGPYTPYKQMTPPHNHSNHPIPIPYLYLYHTYTIPIPIPYLYHTICGRVGEQQIACSDWLKHKPTHTWARTHVANH